MLKEQNKINLPIVARKYYYIYCYEIGMLNRSETNQNFDEKSLPGNV